MTDQNTITDFDIMFVFYVVSSDGPGSRFLVALLLVRDLLLHAKHLFVAAIDGLGFTGACRELANQNMTAGPVAFGAGAILKGPAKQSADAGNAARQKAMG